MIGRKSILSAEARASLEPLPQQETSPESDKQVYCSTSATLLREFEHGQELHNGLGATHPDGSLRPQRHCTIRRSAPTIGRALIRF